MSRKTRKLIWAAPLVAVFAVAGALALFMTLTPNSALAQQGEAAPGMPTDLNLRALDQTTIELTWKAPADDAGGIPDGYRIDYSADGLIWYSLAPAVATSANPKYVDNHDLEASEERHYRIFAFNTGGSSAMLGPMSTMTTTSTVPEAPTALVVNPGVDDTTATDEADRFGDANEEHLVISWDPPVDPPGAPVTTFRLQVSKSSSGPFINLKGAEALKAKDVCSGTGASRQCTHTDVDLFENTAQWYRVYARNKINEGPASEIRGDETDEGAIPTAPRNLRAALSTAGRMALYWDRPAESAAPNNTGKYDPPGAPITAYYIQGGPVVNTADVPTEFVQPDGTALTGDNPQDPRTNQVYYYSAGTDVPLTSTILNTLDNFAGKPNGTNTHWGFRVMAINSVVARNVADGTITPDTGTPADGDGIWSSIIRVNNDNELADALPKPTLEADRHTPSNRGRTGIELEWEVAGAPTGTEYRVEYSEDRIDWMVLTGDAFLAPNTTAGEPPTGAVDATAIAGVHVGLTASTTYSYRVFAALPDGGTDGTDAGTNDFVFTEASGPVSESTTTADRPTTPALTAPVAESETELRMTVIVEEATATETPATPGAESGDTEVGFGKLVGYRIEISDDGRDWTKYDPVMIGAKLDVVYSYSEKDKEVTEEERDAGETVEFRHTDLTQKSTRYYRASTVNNAPGSSAYSVATDPAVKGTTDASLTSDDPGGLVVKAKSDTVIELFWNARADDIEAAKVEKYKIEYSAVNDEGECAEEWMTAEEETETSATYYEHTGLMPETGYCYRIFGINVVGTSTSFVGFGDAYAATYDSDAQATTDAAPTNNAPMAGADIDPQTVAVDGMVDVQSTITDADMGDTLTWEWSSSDMTVATVAMDATDGSMATITGVAGGMATITVTATDMADAMDSQSFTVTVTPDAIRPTITGTPTVLENSISVLWDVNSNQGAEQIKVALFDLDENGDVVRLAEGYEGNVHTINPAVGNPGAHTFTNVPAGTYKVAVANYANGEHKSIVSGVVTVQ